MVPPYNKDTELGTSEQEVFLASKMTRGYLEPKKTRLKSYFKWCIYFEISSKLVTKSGYLFNITTYFKLNKMTILLKTCELITLINTTSQNVSFTSIQDFCSDYISWVSFLESSSSNIFALCEKNLKGLIDLID